MEGGRQAWHGGQVGGSEHAKNVDEQEMEWGGRGDRLGRD
jgi:hypothetical protein